MMRLHTYDSITMPGWRVFLAAAILLTGCLYTNSPAHAEEQGGDGYLPATYIASALAGLEVKKAYALGVGRFELDTETEVIGWRLNETWYFGRQDGLDSGLTLVWHQHDNQVSLSKDGVRLTKRF